VSTSTTKQPPKVLRRDTPEAVLFRQEIWNRLHIDNEHYQAGVFGREGKGKSGTALSVAAMVDPDITIDQTMFRPGKLLKRIHEWKREGTTKGRVIVADEAGVGMGNRTWYEEDQIRFAQVLQLIRSENMGILFTVPRGTEMDSQIRGGRLHAQWLVNNKVDGEYVELEYEQVNVSRRVDNDQVWTPKPDMRIGQLQRRIETIRVGPPPDDLWEGYVEKKNRFQTEEYKEAAGDMGEGDEEEINEMKEIAMEVADDKMHKVVSMNQSRNEPYVNKDLVRLDYDVSHADANAVKSLLEKQFNKEELEDYV